MKMAAGLSEGARGWGRRRASTAGGLGYNMRDAGVVSREGTERRRVRGARVRCPAAVEERRSVSSGEVEAENMKMTEAAGRTVPPEAWKV